MDLISRQDAIDAVEFGITYAKAINKSTGEVKELFKEGNKALNEAVEQIKDLPSAQPEPMSDLISRQAAIDALMEIMDRPRHAEFLYTDEICKTLNELPSAQPESQWIPVAERLPEIKQRVLITYNTEDGLKTDVTWYDKYGFMLSGDVTAWMPMVKPYKEENGE